MANYEGIILDWNLAGTYCNYHLDLNESKQSFLKLQRSLYECFSSTWHSAPVIVMLCTM